MILGDSLQVMASLAEREGLRGKVQCIYLDPPYGIKFNSNFQWSTTSRDVKDGNADHITREPEQVKAFRDTWRDGIHSYLTYLRDRLTVARDLLAESGSIFVQIGDENVHRVRAVMDEVFGEENFVAQIAFTKTTGLDEQICSPAVVDYLLWYREEHGTAQSIGSSYRDESARTMHGCEHYTARVPTDRRRSTPLSRRRRSTLDRAIRRAASLSLDNLTSQGRRDRSTIRRRTFRDRRFDQRKGGWKTNATGHGTP